MDISLDILQEIVVSAGREELLPRFRRVERMEKADGSVLTEADLAVQSRIGNALRDQWPETDFLSEEMSVTEQASLIASERPVWCLDPLDGTSNFAAGIPYYSISLAMLQHGRVELGVVYDPVREECFVSDGGQAMLNNEQIEVKDTGLTLSRSIALVDFKRLDGELARRLVTDIPYASQRSFGSVALDWCWLAAGRGHLYLHGRSSIWDYAAGNFIFGVAGGYSSTLSGESVFAQSLEKRSSVAAVDRGLFDAWREWLAPGDA